MKIHILLLTLLSLSLCHLTAAIPAPEKLLGRETLFVLTVPNASKASEIVSEWPANQFWNDPSMKAFKDKFMKKLSTDVVAPLEKELGIRFSDYRELAQGQITLAVVPNQWDKDPSKEPAFLLLLDAGDKSEDLKKNLTNLKKKWTDSGKSLRTEKIRGIDFSILSFAPSELAASFDRAFEGEDEAETAEESDPGTEEEESKVDWLIGQSDSLLVLGDSKEEIEKLLARKSGGSVPSLSDEPLYAADHSKHFRKSMAYGWVNLHTFIDALTRQLTKAEEGQPQENELFATPKPAAIMKTLGLSGLKTGAFAVQEIAQGTLITSSLKAPENLRKGILDIFKLERKDASPLPFVSEDTIKFSRTRINLPNALATIEKMLAEISPPMAGIVQMVMANAGKDTDPSFDLRKNLIGNLGDDMISFQKEPTEKSLTTLASPPTLYLLNSPRPRQLAAALKALTGLMPSDGSSIKEREFLGRTIYSMSLPPTMSPDGKQISNKLSYTATADYVAMSTDTSMLEEYLRNTNEKPLRSSKGLRQAAEKVGGMNTGLFGYENDRVTVRLAMEVLKKESSTLANLFGNAGLAGALPGMGNQEGFKDWLDFSLLPSFEQVAKYFYFTVYSGGLDDQGFNFKIYSPNPPNLK